MTEAGSVFFRRPDHEAGAGAVAEIDALPPSKTERALSARCDWLRKSPPPPLFAALFCFPSFFFMKVAKKRRRLRSPRSFRNDGRTFNEKLSMRPLKPRDRVSSSSAAWRLTLMQRRVFTALADAGASCALSLLFLFFLPNSILSQSGTRSGVLRPVAGLAIGRAEAGRGASGRSGSLARFFQVNWTSFPLL